MKPPKLEHLFFDGRHYDQRYRFTRDIPFWISQVKKYGDPVLELARGTGRISIPLAKEGFQVTGIDISDSMLSEAEKKSTQVGINIQWIKGDIRDFDLKKKFPLIIFPANTICNLYDLEELEACLYGVNRHLSPGGRLVIDVFNPRLDILLRNPKERYPHSEYPDPDTKAIIKVTENNVYDSSSQVNFIKLYYKLPGQAEESIEELNMRIYFPQELDVLLRYNGFKIEAKLGDYDEKPFTSDSPKQLIICRTINE
jgi:ubiquinone/menaquinone biosynthesis C-methylase UbiE